MRKIDYIYDDPLSVIWVQTAMHLGVTIRRDDTVFASWDGNGTLTIGTDDTLDPDDSLAQMIFHEICHALTEGPEAFRLPDWGLDNDREDHIVREHACLRLQAKLAGDHGLRNFLATTTDFRSYYDNLPNDPLADSDDPAIPLARAAWQRATEGLWAAKLREALARTATIRDLVNDVAGEQSIWGV